MPAPKNRRQGQQPDQTPQDAPEAVTPDADTTQDVSTPQDAVQQDDGPVLDDAVVEDVANANQTGGDDVAVQDEGKVHVSDEDKLRKILGDSAVDKLTGAKQEAAPAQDQQQWPKKVRLTINPDAEVEVDQADYENLKHQKLIASE